MKTSIFALALSAGIAAVVPSAGMAVAGGSLAAFAPVADVTTETRVDFRPSRGDRPSFGGSVPFESFPPFGSNGQSGDRPDFSNAPRYGEQPPFGNRARGYGHGQGRPDFRNQPRYADGPRFDGHPFNGNRPQQRYDAPHGDRAALLERMRAGGQPEPSQFPPFVLRRLAGQ